MPTSTGPRSEIQSFPGDSKLRPADEISHLTVPELKAAERETVDHSNSFAFCHEVSRREAGNFYWSFRLLPPESRQAMCTLYAFMRHTDDLADREAPIAEREADLNRWRSLLDQALDFRGDSEFPSLSEAWPGFPALAETVRKFGIPREYLHAVIDGMKFDLGPVRIENADQFQRYCWHVASAVGLCCLHIWGFESRGGRAEALAERLGLAFQRTNILRDVAEDYARGRIYLPDEDLHRHHLTDADLAASRACPGLKALVAEHAAIARAEYQAAGDLIPLISPACRPMLRAIARIYEGVLDTIERQNYDVLVHRAALPKWRKAAIMIGAIFG